MIDFIDEMGDMQVAISERIAALAAQTPPLNPNKDTPQ
jgi:hypothetical protein